MGRGGEGGGEGKRRRKERQAEALKTLLQKVVVRLSKCQSLRSAHPEYMDVMGMDIEAMGVE
jgi:hypothetical protein